MGRAEARAAILVVNGGPDPAGGHWLDLCLSKVQELTRWPGYRVYVWNNDTGDARVAGLLERLPEATLLEADPAEELAHPHAVPLQRLYERARDEGADVIVTLDSDAHPLRAGWLGSLIGALAGPVVAAGVWRDELQPARPPYLHASCLCTTVEFLESQQLGLDFIAPNTGDETHDTLSSITERTEALGLDLHKLRRSNRNDFHRLVGGVYGDLIYHHGAGSRALPSFWGESREDAAVGRNRRMVEIAAWLLMRDYDRYMDWLHGRTVDERFSEKMEALRHGNFDARPLRSLPIGTERAARRGLVSRTVKDARRFFKRHRSVGTRP